MNNGRLKAEKINWLRPYESARRLYEDGKYLSAYLAASDAVSQAMKAYELTLRKRMWGARFAGLKDEKIRDEMYKIARQDALQIISMSEDVEIRNSAIKLLILLPGEDIKKWCVMGIDELQSAELVGIATEEDKGDLIAELKNSLGSAIKKENPEKALKIFLDAYDLLSKKGTTLAGHLMQNAGTCQLMLADVEKDESRRLAHPEKAREYLGKALENYPRDQTAHRETTSRKLNDAIEKIKKITSAG